MALQEMTGRLTPSSELKIGQPVHVAVGVEDLGTGIVDAVADDGTLWVFFGGLSPRRLFIEDDAAEFRVLPPKSAR